jgi:hypothetical protein
VFEQGNASEKTTMIDLSSSLDEENFIVDTSHDAELIKKNFGDLNRDTLRPPGDSKIIVLDDSDEENGAHKEKTTVIESMAAPTSADPASSAPTSADDPPVGAKIDNSDDPGPIRRLMAATAVDVASRSLRLQRQEQGDAVSVL